MLNHMTPPTLKEIHKDLNKARLATINETTERNIECQMKKYQRLESEMEEVAAQFETLTGKPLWAETDYDYV